ncbi:hypothetical protein [Streptomyces sp. SID13726]|uniref:hypothetical protein n=1 Tax=Streptomyces sp. SID13726 TaxID=2706058 RepID=UPI0019419A8B|nr:hypothetical protein [Streptomyces sp. SID13726]
MRLFTPALLGLAVAAVLGSAPPAAPHPGSAAVGSDCAPDGRTFPLTTRIHGGPDAYEAGGGYGTWYLDLTNTTGRTCADIHPVVVLVDRARSLRPGQPRLEFYDGEDPHPVTFETTDEDELVGAFADDKGRFPGFTVGPGRTVSVKVRLALTSDTAPNEVTATAAVVQRHGNDGDWVGQSEDYAFRVEDGPVPGSSTSPGPDERSPLTDAAERAQELARTGLATPAALLTAAFLLVTGALLLIRRPTGPRRRR